MTRRQLGVLERRDWLRLSRSENVGPITFHHLLRRYGNVADALDALPELSARGGLKRAITMCPEEDAERELAAALECGARHVAICEPDYPPRLRHIADPPPILCVRGDTDLATRPVLGVVGPRKASAVGLKFARTVAAQLGAAGLVIVSGLARGIDTASHMSSLETGTIAAIAGGIDVVYPPENAELQEAIGTQGLLISETPPGARPQAKAFPRRNRLISGISLGVLVVEAAQRSGTLITARMALEQGRELFAVPGSPLDPRAAGTNRLIRNGAHLTRSSSDVLEVLQPLIERHTVPSTYGPGELWERDDSADDDLNSADVAEDARARLLELLGPAPVNLDDLIRESGVSPGEVHLVLLELELAGRLTRAANNTVALY